MEYALGHKRLFVDTLETFGNRAHKFTEHLVDHIVPSHRNHYRPHVLHNRALALYGALLLAVKICVLSIGIMSPVEFAYSSAITQTNIFNLTNASREASKIKPLVWNDKLASAAEAKAKDMLEKGYFSHTSPDSRLPWDFITSTGYNYLTAGENLAEGFLEAEATETAWMNSPGHKANILNKNFEEIGIGISQGEYQGHKTIFVVQMFGTPIDQPVKVLDQPTKVSVSSEEKPLLAPPEPKPVVNNESSVTPAPQTSVTPQAGAQAPAGSLEIQTSRAYILGSNLVVTVKTTDSAVRVLALFGDIAIYMDPKPENIWEGSTPLSKISQVNATIKAWDIRGASTQIHLASFAPTLQNNFLDAGEVKGDSVSFFGYDFYLSGVESKFYLIFIAALLSALVLAIGLKKHVQHIGLVANTSLVAVLALLFWIG